METLQGAIDALESEHGELKQRMDVLKGVRATPKVPFVISRYVIGPSQKAVDRNALIDALVSYMWTVCDIPAPVSLNTAAGVYLSIRSIQLLYIMACRISMTSLEIKST